MSNQEYRKRHGRRKARIWIVAGVIVLILLLFFWVDIVELLGGGLD